MVSRKFGYGCRAALLLHGDVCRAVLRGIFKYFIVASKKMLMEY